jgi:plasmid stabilization system protein ParE
MITCTEAAADLLSTAEQAARRFNADARIRLVADATSGVRFDLADGPEPGDEVVEHARGFTLFVAPGLSGTVDVAEPHDRLVLRPSEPPAQPA